MAKQLANLKYQVFAGVLFDQGDGAAKLRAYSPNINVVKVDVTKYMEIVSAKQYVEANLDKNRSKYNLIN